MVLFLTVDANRGMEFNHRPVSKDAEVTKKIEQIKKFRTTEYNEKCLINPAPDSICWSEVSNVYIFNFNRVYSSDVIFKWPADMQFVLTSFDTFRGSSHSVITMEVYSCVR